MFCGRPSQTQWKEDPLRALTTNVLNVAMIVATWGAGAAAADGKAGSAVSKLGRLGRAAAVVDRIMAFMDPLGTVIGVGVSRAGSWVARVTGMRLNLRGLVDAWHRPADVDVPSVEGPGTRPGAGVDVDMTIHDGWDWVRLRAVVSSGASRRRRASQSSALRQAARRRNQQLFACFVINVPDSIEGIFESVRDASVISKFGGGVGGNFGHLREFGSEIGGGTGGKASGPVSFIETWNIMGAVVVQGGKRRAALMGMLFDDHPDIYRFVDCKTEDGKLSYFNVSA